MTGRQILMDFFYFQRFYGKSLPFGNKSFSHPYVGLLSIEQALGDYAILLSTLKQELNARLPVLSLLLVAGLTLSLNYFDFEVLINLVKLVNLVHTNKLNLKKINEQKEQNYIFTIF